MNADDPLFIETPLATPLYDLPKGSYPDIWQAQWRRWRFWRRKASNITKKEFDDVLQQP